MLPPPSPVAARRTTLPGKLPSSSSRHNAVTPATRLGFKHMSKCGGTDIIASLRESQINFTLYDEATGLTAARTKDTFVMASVRNTCSYLLSLWAYQARKPWAQVQNRHALALGFSLWNQTGRTHFQLDGAAFAAWSRLTMDSGRHSIMAYRFFETLVRQRDGLKCAHDRLLRCASSFDDKVVERGLHSFSKRSQVDCWIFLENL